MTTTQTPAVNTPCANCGHSANGHGPAVDHAICSVHDCDCLAYQRATPVQIPARELAVGDVISMGTISDVDIKETYVALRFEAKYGEHGTAFPLDLMVTVLSRAVPPFDLATELTALADEWDSPVSTVTRPYRSFSQEDCAAMLRELLARVR